MGLVSGITRRVEVPHEPGAYFTFRMLSWLQLKEARDVRLAAILAQAAAFANMKDLMSSATTAKKEEEPLAGYDPQVLLRNGIESWTYGETVTPDDLDERTAEWAALEVLALSVPTADVIKKDLSRSTATSAAAADLPTNG